MPLFVDDSNLKQISLSLCLSNQYKHARSKDACDCSHTRSLSLDVSERVGWCVLEVLFFVPSSIGRCFVASLLALFV